MESNKVTNNNESILSSIKKLIGLSDDYDAFDNDLIIHINSVFSILNQLGVGPKEGFKIEGDYETWSDFTQNELFIEDVKTYVYLRVRLIFDPPLNSSVLESMKQTVSELEWRLNIMEKEDTEINNG